MKKLMIMLAAVAMAAVSQAASVDWQYGVTAAKSTMGGEYAALTTDKLVVYFFDADTWTGISKVTKDSFGSALDSSHFVANGSAPQGAKYSTTQTDGTTVGARALSDASWGATLDAVYVVVDTSSDTWTYSEFAKTLTTRGEQEGNNGTGNLSNTLTALNSATWKSVSSSSVPEPTSGLLVLLGVAGLALRRRRA